MKNPIVKYEISGAEYEVKALTFPSDERFRNAWMVIDGVIMIDPAKIHIIINILANDIEIAMYKHIETGVQWSLDRTTTVQKVALSDSLQAFLIRYQSKRKAGRSNPHKGKLFTRDGSFEIDDAGLDELSLFAGLWGDEISYKRLALIDGLDLMTVEQLILYDVNAIDWTIDWANDVQNDDKGWSDNRCIQNYQP